MRKKIDLWENVISEDAFSNAFHISLSGKSYVALKSGEFISFAISPW